MLHGLANHANRGGLVDLWFEQGQGLSWCGSQDIES